MQGLQVTVTSDVLLIDEDIRNGSLTLWSRRKVILDVTSIWFCVQFQDSVTRTKILEKPLGSSAIRAIGFREDHDPAVSNQSLDFISNSSHF